MNKIKSQNRNACGQTEPSKLQTNSTSLESFPQRYSTLQLHKLWKANDRLQGAWCQSDSLGRRSKVLKVLKGFHLA